MRSALEVGKATVKGAGMKIARLVLHPNPFHSVTIWDSLESAGSTFLYTTKDTTVQLVDHK